MNGTFFLGKFKANFFEKCLSRGPPRFSTPMIIREVKLALMSPWAWSAGN